MHTAVFYRKLLAPFGVNAAEFERILDSLKDAGNYIQKSACPAKKPSSPQNQACTKLCGRQLNPGKRRVKGIRPRNKFSEIFAVNSSLMSLRPSALTRCADQDLWAG